VLSEPRDVRGRWPSLDSGGDRVVKRFDTLYSTTHSHMASEQAAISAVRKARWRLSALKSKCAVMFGKRLIRVFLPLLESIVSVEGEKAVIRVSSKVMYRDVC